MRLGKRWRTWEITKCSSARTGCETLRTERNLSRIRLSPPTATTIDPVFVPDSKRALYG